MMHLTIGDALAALGAEGRTYTKLFGRTDLDIALYKPDRVDPQQPHLRDEIYVVATGSGRFVLEDESRTVAPGDVLFVSKGAAHRFVGFTEDFSTWVIFFGVVPVPSP